MNLGRILKSLVTMVLVSCFLLIIIRAARKLRRREIGTLFQRINEDTVMGSDLEYVI